MNDLFVHNGETYQIVAKLQTLSVPEDDIKKLKAKYNSQVVIKMNNKLLFLQEIKEVTIIE